MSPELRAMNASVLAALLKLPKDERKVALASWREQWLGGRLG